MPIVPGVDVVVGAARSVQAGDDAVERLDAGRVLELVEAEDVGVEAGQSAASSLSRWRVNSSGWSESAPRQSRLALPPHGPGTGVVGGRVEREEEVQRVLRGDREPAADGLRRGRTRVDRGVVGRGRSGRCGRG